MGGAGSVEKVRFWDFAIAVIIHVATWVWAQKPFRRFEMDPPLIESLGFNGEKTCSARTGGLVAREGFIP